MFGLENKSPIDLVLDVEDGDTTTTSAHEFVEERATRMRHVYRLVRDYLGIATNRRKDYYAGGSKESSEIRVGSWVW